MKNLLKKNQLMITALAIMIAIAGYLQFAGNTINDDYLLDKEGENNTSQVDSGDVITENYTAQELEDGLLEIQSLDSDMDAYVENYLDDEFTVTDEIAWNELDINEDISEASKDISASSVPDEGEIPGEAVLTSGDYGNVVLSDAKLLKEQTRSKNKETLLEIINSAQISEQQKNDAIASMVRMTEIAEKEASAEILLEAKGFLESVVSINEDSVDVVVNALQLSDAQRAQIEDIITRKTGMAADKVRISTIVQ